ncbi:MAG: hypothetical protein ACREBW_03410 [Candidatus Micrarchaeaceae archaeon]
MRVALLLVLAMLLPSIALQLSHASYNICGEFANDCQPASSVQCPAYCYPAAAPQGFCQTKLAQATGPYDICVPYYSTGASTTMPQLQQGTGVPVPPSSTSPSSSSSGTSGSYPPSGTLLTSVQLTCTLYTGLHNIAFVLSLLLMILGGVLYAGAHVLPSVSRPAIQSYGMGLLIGGLALIIIVLASAWLLGLLSNIPDIASICVPV